MSSRRKRYSHSNPRPGRAGQRKTATERSLRQWAEANPLWQWRARARMTRPMAAAMLGVTNTAIWNWEHGSAMPSPENMDKLVALLGPDTVHQWVVWVSKKPGWEKEAG